MNHVSYVLMEHRNKGYFSFLEPSYSFLEKNRCTLHKFYFRNINWLGNEGRFWLAYRGKWELADGEMPQRWMIMYGIEDSARVYVAQRWKTSDNFTLLGLQVTDCARPLITCFHCGGSCTQSIDYGEVEAEYPCTTCYGLGKLDHDPRADLVTPESNVRILTELEDYDRKLTELYDRDQEDQARRRERRNRRNKK